MGAANFISREKLDLLRRAWASNMPKKRAVREVGVAMVTVRRYYRMFEEGKR